MDFLAQKKQKGDLLKSEDWNALTEEVERLAKDKLDRNQSDTFRGSLTVEGALNIKSKSGNEKAELKMEGNLNVSQSLSVDGELTVKGIGNSSVAGNLTVSGNVTAKRLALAGELTVKGTETSSFAGNLTVSGAMTTGGLSVSGSVSFLSKTMRQIINLWEQGYGIGIQAMTQYFRTDQNFAWYKGGTHNDNGLNSGGGTVQMVIKDGNVGIGIDNPGDYKLNVEGNQLLRGSLTIQEGKLNLNGNQQIVFTDTDTNNNLKLQLRSGYGLGINNNTLFYTSDGNHSWRDHQHTERMLLTTGSNGGLTVKGTGTSYFAGDLDVSGRITGNINARHISGILGVAQIPTLLANKITPSDPKWQTPEKFINSWGEFGGNVYNPVGYFKDSLGIVHLRGLVKNFGSGSIEDTIIFTLPKYYTPSKNEVISVLISGPNTEKSSIALGRVDIHSNGEVRAVVGHKNWLSLDGITFRAGEDL